MSCGRMLTSSFIMLHKFYEFAYYSMDILPLIPFHISTFALQIGPAVYITVSVTVYVHLYYVLDM